MDKVIDYRECVEFLKKLLNNLDMDQWQVRTLSNMRINKAQYERLFECIMSILDERDSVDYVANQQKEKIDGLVGRLQILDDELRFLEPDEKEAFRKAAAVYNFPARLTETIDGND
jgi:hypothetical protein